MLIWAWKAAVMRSHAVLKRRLVVVVDMDMLWHDILQPSRGHLPFGNNHQSHSDERRTATRFSSAGPKPIRTVLAGTHRNYVPWCSYSNGEGRQLDRFKHRFCLCVPTPSRATGVPYTAPLHKLPMPLSRPSPVVCGTEAIHAQSIPPRGTFIDAKLAAAQASGRSEVS